VGWGGRRGPGGEWEGRARVRYLYIAGKWTGAADDGTSQTINPYDATPLETVAEACAADVDAAVAAAREAFDEGPWRRSTVTERAALLSKIADLLQRDRD
jgi:betaine-aldehyde dehydrogenase